MKCFLWLHSGAEAGEDPPQEPAAKDPGHPRGVHLLQPDPRESSSTTQTSATPPAAFLPRDRSFLWRVCAIICDVWQF